MEKITITIETVNAAFEEYPEQEVARILRELADSLANGFKYNIRDINGNTCGTVETE